MSLEQDLAQRFLYTEDNHTRTRRRYRPVVRISIIGIALGIALVLLSFFITQGFKTEVRNKLDGFLGNVKISNPENTFNQYTLSLTIPPDLLGGIMTEVQGLDPQSRVFTFIDQMGILRGDSTFKGVFFHGVDSLYNSNFYAQYLTTGTLPTFNGEDYTQILLSYRLAQQMKLGVGDEFRSYFYVGDQLKVRKFRLTGIFDTGFPEYDQALAITDIRTLRTVNGWESNEVGGIEVHTSKHSYTAPLFARLYEYLADRNARVGERYTMFTSEELYPSIFGWLDLLDANVLLILGLMVAIAGMTMITGIVVLMLEKVSAIATLKALGYGNRQLRSVFRKMAYRMLLQGMLWGNLLAIGIAMIQEIWHPITLDPTQYYTAFAPIQIDPLTIIAVNAVVFILVVLLVLIPTSVVSHIRPAQALRFE